MLAIEVAAFGAPDVLRPVQLADPRPGPGQVVIAVERAAIVFIDTLIRAGRGFGGPRELPYVPGNGVGGTVAELGEGVAPEWLHRRVISTTGGTGGYAERVVVDAGLLIPVPDEVDLDDAVAVLAVKTLVSLFAA